MLKKPSFLEPKSGKIRFLDSSNINVNLASAVKFCEIGDTKLDNLEIIAASVLLEDLTL